MDIVLPGGSDLFSGGDYRDSGSVAYPNASEDDLINALAAMERGDIEYVILQDDRSDLLIQVTGSPRQGYILEYSDGSDDTLYRANGTVSGFQVTEALTAFLNRDSMWRTAFVWHKFSDRGWCDE